MRLSGLQKEVLSLYRSTLREIRKKPETSRQHFRDFARAEFDRNLVIDKRDFAAVEYLLRKGRRSSHHFPKFGFKPSVWSSRNAPNDDPNNSPASPVGATTVARKRRSAVGHLHHYHHPSPLNSCAVAKPRPHQRNVIRKRRRSRVKAGTSFVRSSTSGTASLGAKRKRTPNPRVTGANNRSGSECGRGKEAGKPKGLHNWVTRHILSSKDDIDPAASQHVRSKPLEISHPIPLNVHNDNNTPPTLRESLGPLETDKGRYSLMQVPEVTINPIAWLQASRPGISFADHVAVGFQGLPMARSEYAHVGPLNSNMGYDGTVSTDDFQPQTPRAPQPMISRKPVPCQGRDAERTGHRGREHVALVSSLPTSKREKRFGLADPTVWGSVSRTLSQQHRLSEIISPERSDKSSSILIEAQSRSSSKRKKLNRFTKELERYHASHPRPADSSSGALPSSPSIKTVSALVPYRSEFAAAGLAVTSKEQKELAHSKASHLPRNDPHTRAIQHLGLPTASQLDGKAMEPVASPNGNRSSSSSDIRITPPGGIPGLLADDIFPTPDIDRKPASPRKILPWLCYPASETSASDGKPYEKNSENAHQLKLLHGPTCAVPTKLHTSPREGNSSSRQRAVTEKATAPDSASPAKGTVEKNAPNGMPRRETSWKVPPIPTKSTARPVERSTELPAISSAKKGIPDHEKGLSVQYTAEVLTTPPPQSNKFKTRTNTVARQRVYSASNGSPRTTGAKFRVLPELRSSLARQQPPLPEELEPSPSSTMNFNKPLPKTPPEQQKTPSTGHKATNDSGQTGRSPKQVKNLTAIVPETSPKYERVSTRSPPKLPHTWKYAIITDSSFEEALDAVVHKLEALDDAAATAKVPILSSATPPHAKQPSRDPPKISITEPTPEAEEQARVGLNTSVEDSPSPAQPGNPLFSLNAPDSVVKAAAKVLLEDQAGGNESDWEDQPKAPAKCKELPLPPHEPFVDQRDRDICDRDVLKGLRLAIEAACDEEFDAWIRNQTGLRLRRFLADLKGFEGLQRDAEAIAEAEEAAIRAAAQDYQPARRRRAEQRRQAAIGRHIDGKDMKKGVC
ncbi:hypothetical protein MCOR27_001628 [Pyricularia oryzae]|nr:hypothetical protein MCOR26_005958 [Pyricularia oryzae]KAI6287014.1 hypothetical protein MCOR27_001628 [Pyricularia oryzae]KAI6307063.1 hypothetical protein MCOR29_009825 [Pyricularia oryzae]KAI6379084.1 hypothetical protein MCOR31_000408 [Pyricularia oryzae]KAI6384339.1 hypothetical protein MCOR32_002065 [Pyricularia oryzae]